MQPYTVIQKSIGETPLQALEKYRTSQKGLEIVPMAYAGRLDPMASGTLLILIGDECKKQTNYHGLDKSYTIEVLFGLESDTGDILGRLTSRTPPSITTPVLQRAIKHLPKHLSLPYPTFSAKTVKGKPLHMWTLEGRLDEIEIPIQHGTIHRITLNGLSYVRGSDIYSTAIARINSLPKVTEERKALGADFRRDNVRADWRTWREQYGDQTFSIANITCLVSSGTYMRSLAAYIAKECKTTGLAFSIHRTDIGIYQPLYKNLGWWRKRFT